MNKLFFLLIVSLYSSILLSQDNLEKNAYSIIDNHSIEFICESNTSAVKKESLTVTILSPKDKSAAEFLCMCDKFTSLRKFSGEMMDKFGNTIKKIKKSDLQLSEYSSGLTSDDYVYFYETSLPFYPITIKYEWEIKYKNGLIGFPTFIPQSRYNQSVKKSSYKFVSSPDINCRYKEVNIENAVKETFLPNNTICFEATIENLMAIEREVIGAELIQLVPIIHFSPTDFYFDGSKGNISTWQSYGAWLDGLQQDRLTLPEPLKEKITELTKDCKTDRDKVKALYDFLAASTRYVSIQLGIGGLQPFAASEVYRTGFGDCKGLSNYMRAMLNYVNIPANYTVINTVNKNLLKDFSSGNQMNHAILQVPLPNDTIWLECTNPQLPFGYIHNRIAGNNAVVVVENGGIFTRLPSYTDTLNTQTIFANIDLSNEGNAKMKVSQRSKLFQYENQVGFKSIEDAKKKDYLRNQLNLTDAKIESIKIDEYKDSHPLIDITYDVTTDVLGNKTGTRLFVPANIFRSKYNLSTNKHRTQDIYINYGYVDIDTIKINLPNSYVVESSPKNMSISTTMGSFQSHYEIKESTIYIYNRLYMKSGVYNKELYPELLALYTAINNQDKAQFVLRKE